jgi:hypothetical protein
VDGHTIISGADVRMMVVKNTINDELGETIFIINFSTYIMIVGMDTRVRRSTRIMIVPSSSSLSQSCLAALGSSFH